MAGVFRRGCWRRQLVLRPMMVVNLIPGEGRRGDGGLCRLKRM